MSWFKVDDEVHGSLKRLQASTAAMGLWAMAGSWSRKRKTAGFIPRTALRVIAPDLSDEIATALATELVEAKVDGIHEHGFWLPLANGWQFHEWEERNPADDVEAERSANLSAIRREAGLRGAQARWQKDGKQDDGKNSFATTVANGKAPLPPTPPNPDPPPSTGSDPVSDRNEISDSDPDFSSLAGSSEDLTESAREDDSKPKARAAEKSPFRTDNERRVFEYWAKTVWQKVHREGTARATSKRVSAIRARLRENISPELLERVCDNVAASAWHMGENDGGKAHYETHLIFRSREKVEWWLTQKAPKPPGAVEHERQQAAENMRLVEQAKRGEYGERIQKFALDGRLTGEALSKFREKIRMGDIKRMVREPRRPPEPASSPQATVAAIVPDADVASLLPRIGRAVP